MENFLIIIIYVSIFLFFILGLFFTICWIYVLKQAPNISNVVIGQKYTKSSYGNRCTTKNVNNSEGLPINFYPQNCDKDLTCVYELKNSDYGICKKSLGQKCNSINECVLNALFCDGECKK